MNICVIGGDSRIVELVKICENSGDKLYLYGLEKCEELQQIDTKGSLVEMVQNSDFVVTSIPLSKDGKIINAPFSNKTISVEEVFETARNKKIITGNVTSEINKYIKLDNNNEIIDILTFEELAIQNAIPTAEGAIQMAMEKSKITLHNSNCLVLGFGRIGKVLAKMLSGIGAHVYCEARKQQDIAWINAYQYNAIHLNEINNLLGKFDFIFNTIPYMVLDKNNLPLIKRDCLMIDLASKPGGIDYNEAKKLSLSVEWLLALPGKVAPKTSAQYIYEIIKRLY